MHSKNFTQEDLAKVGKLYDDNADKLMASTAGSEEWKEYLREERRLHNLDIAIRKHLGLFVTLRGDGTIAVGNGICKTCGISFPLIKREGRGDILYCSKGCQWEGERKALKKKEPRPWTRPMNEWAIKPKEASIENANIT